MDKTLMTMLAKEFPSEESVSTEIINLNAICCLPKGTEYFFSDPHGEAEAFGYLLSTASGVIPDKIETMFSKSVPAEERKELSILIPDPARIISAHRAKEDFSDWCRITIYRLVTLCRELASKYTRSKVRKMMPVRFMYVLDELLHADTEESKNEYYAAIIDAVIHTGIAADFIAELCSLIRKCAIDRLHIIGDLFDRGPRADLIIDQLMMFPNVDFQWGNHDIHWLGASLGSPVCVASVVRLCISYNNFDLLEDGYGINLRPLSMFAAEIYRDDPCELFLPHLLDKNKYDPVDSALAAKMNKAAAIIEFKLEGQLIRRHPEYGMSDRVLLENIDWQGGMLRVGGKKYPLRDRLFPTVDPGDPLALTKEEQALIDSLALSFTHSKRLQKHFRYLFSNAGLYRIYNGNLLYHGCIPTTEDGEFEKVPISGKLLSGKKYMDAVNEKLKSAVYLANGREKSDALDFIWYLWSGPKSPLFGKSKLSTFERIFTDAPELCEERLDPYYAEIEKREYCEKILHEFGLSPEHSHIINGHVPVRIGEHPLKGGGLLYIIDGGISKAYHSRTGIGGYTLIFTSHHYALAQHKPFEEICRDPAANVPTVRVTEVLDRRMRVADTDTGRALQAQISLLEELLAAYRSGTMPEKV